MVHGLKVEFLNVWWFLTFDRWFCIVSPWQGEPGQSVVPASRRKSGGVVASVGVAGGCRSGIPIMWKTWPLSDTTAPAVWRWTYGPLLSVEGGSEEETSQKTLVSQAKHFYQTVAVGASVRWCKISEAGNRNASFKFDCWCCLGCSGFEKKTCI